jgi:hypothetical protein
LVGSPDGCYFYLNAGRFRVKMETNVDYSVLVGSPDGSMSSVLWAKTQQLQEDAFRQLQNIYGEIVYNKNIYAQIVYS